MKTSLLIIFLVVPLLLTACGAAPSQPTPDVAFVQTSAASTVIANFTNTAAAAVTFTPLAAVTTAPAPQATATLIPATLVGTVGPTATLLPGGVTATQALCDHYTWNPATIDVNVPDGTQMTPGQQFVKTWKIKNDGGCTWGAGYTIVYAGYTDQMSGVAQPINGVIGPGQEVEISVSFKAPLKAGEYVSAWTLQNANGIRFYGPAGRPIYVKIVVKL